MSNFSIVQIKELCKDMEKKLNLDHHPRKRLPRDVHLTLSSIYFAPLVSIHHGTTSLKRKPSI